MSEDNPQDPSHKPATTDSKTVLGAGADGGASRRPVGEYSLHRNEASGTHKRPEPQRMPDGTGRNEGSGLLKPSDRTVSIPQQPVPRAESKKTLPGTTPPPNVSKGANEATVMLGPSTVASGTPVPQAATVNAKRASDGNSAVRSSTWDKHADTTGVSDVGETTGVHSLSGAPHPGVRINQYEMIKMIGEGGMGTVFLARDLRLGRRVAIKFLQVQNNTDLTQRFLVEARATARCQHDNIVVIYEVGEHNNSPYMVLEFLNGKPLTSYLDEGERLPYTRAVEIMVSVLRALECAHGQGIVHRDLKPDNIFITDSGTIKVLDFGIAKVLEAQSTASSPQMSSGAIRMPSPLELATGTNNSLTRVGTIMGTLKFMSPEQWGIGIEIDHLSDIWACGVLLHRMICGRHPLHPLDGNQLVVTAMLELPMPSMMEAAPPDCPRELIEIVDRCLLKLKEQRWPNVTELLAALMPYMPGRRTAELQLDESPYAGLSSFQENDAGKFFGRNREIAAMVTRIRDRPMMAVVGSSGVGKSSFVRAGLMPALKRSGETWETLVIRPGRSPMEALGAIVAPMVGTAVNLADEMDEQKKLVDTLRREPGHLGHLLRGRARRDSRRIMLFVDQFEELYTQVTDPEERAAFTACLSAVADDATSPLRVVLSIRSDFLDRIAEDQTFLGELTQGLFFLGQPNREGLRDAIVQPAELAGFKFELPATVEDMLDHLETTPGALPLLQFAAAKLWESRDTARKILSHASYAAMGGVAGALATHADRVVQDLGPANQSIVRAILLRIITPERTRAIVPLDELRDLSREAGAVQRLVDQMVDARLLVVQTLEGGKGSTVEIVHESLIQRWPTLRRWLDETQDDAELVDQLRTAARQWQAKNRSADLLWRGETAEEAKKFRKRYKGPLSDVEQSFLEEVISYEVAVQRRRRTAVIGGFVGLGTLVVLAMVFLVVLQKSRTDAKHQAAIATQANTEAQEAKAQAESASEVAKASQKQAEANLAAAQQKERERLEAEAKTVEVTAEKQVVSGKLDQSQEDLKKTNEELKRSLVAAKDSERKAQRAQVEAEAAKDEALVQKATAESLFKQEQERVKRLQAQIGSSIVDDLK